MTVTTGSPALDRFLTEHLYDFERTVLNYAYSLPQNAERFDTLHQAIRESQRTGSHFFDEATMQTFKTKVYGKLYDGRIFLTSDNGGWGRQYRVTWIAKHPMACDNPEHVRLSVERLETKFPTLNAARRAAAELAAMSEGYGKNADGTAHVPA